MAPPSAVRRGRWLDTPVDPGPQLPDMTETSAGVAL